MNETPVSAMPQDFFKDFIDDRFTDGADRNVFLADLANDSLTSDFFEQSTSTSSPESERSQSSSADGLDEFDQLMANGDSGSDDVAARTSAKLKAGQTTSTTTPGPLFDLADKLGGFDQDLIRKDLIMPPTPAATETRTSFDGNSADGKGSTVAPANLTAERCNTSCSDSQHVVSADSGSAPTRELKSAPASHVASMPAPIPRSFVPATDSIPNCKSA